MTAIVRATIGRIVHVRSCYARDEERCSAAIVTFVTPAEYEHEPDPEGTITAMMFPSTGSPANVNPLQSLAVVAENHRRQGYWLAWHWPQDCDAAVERIKGWGLK